LIRTFRRKRRKRRGRSLLLRLIFLMEGGLARVKRRIRRRDLIVIKDRLKT
jgi:hypothetical protein